MKECINILTRVFEGVEIVEIVWLSAELNALSIISKLFNQERVVPLYDLPNKISRYCCHLILCTNLKCRLKLRPNSKLKRTLTSTI